MPKAKTLEERLWEKIDVGDCWHWTGAKDGDGYGLLNVFSRGVRLSQTTRPHRIVWELLVGPIPEGYEADHQCKNRSCVNPDHIMIKDGSQHAKESQLGIKRRPKMCKRGLHEMAIHAHQRVNGSSKNGWGYCKPCRNARRRGDVL